MKFFQDKPYKKHREYILLLFLAVKTAMILDLFAKKGVSSVEK